MKNMIEASQLNGTAIVPMLTPFTADGQLDRDSIGRLVQHILRGGCQGIMISGTTGEAVSMDKKMRVELMNIVKEYTSDQCVLLFGIGHNCLEQSVSLAHTAFELGVDGVVAHLPAYYDLSSNQMEAWFTSLVDQIQGPTYIYNIPQTTKASIPIEVLISLSHHPNIVGLKDSERDEARQLQLARDFAKRKDFAFFTGFIGAALEIMKAGARGFVPAVGNFFPSKAREIMDAHLLGDYARFDDRLKRLMDISVVFQGDRNVAEALSAMKATASILELCEPYVLQPLQNCGAAEIERIRQELEAFSVIPAMSRS